MWSATQAYQKVPHNEPSTKKWFIQFVVEGLSHSFWREFLSWLRKYFLDGSTRIRIVKWWDYTCTEDLQPSLDSWARRLEKKFTTCDVHWVKNYLHIKWASSRSRRKQKKAVKNEFLLLSIFHFESCQAHTGHQPTLLLCSVRIVIHVETHFFAFIFGGKSSPSDSEIPDFIAHFIKNIVELVKDSSSAHFLYEVQWIEILSLLQWI